MKPIVPARRYHPDWATTPTDAAYIDAEHDRAEDERDDHATNTTAPTTAAGDVLGWWATYCQTRNAS